VRNAWNVQVASFRCSREGSRRSAAALHRRATDWNHKLRNVLDVVPEEHQPAVKLRLQKIASAETQRECEQLKHKFRESCEHVDPKAVERL
jgi:transposase-like protein